LDAHRNRSQRRAAGEALTTWTIVRSVKTGLFASCFVLALVVSSAAAAADPAAASEPKVSVESKTAPASAAKASNGRDSLADPATAEPDEHASSRRDEHGDGADKGGREHADEQFGHGMQFGLRADVVGGYRMIFRYDKSPFCRTPKGVADKDEQKFCGNAAPMAVDVALSFAIVDFAEPYVWARFGLGGEASTNTEAVMAFGAGARIYTMSDSKLKIFVEPAVGMEVEGGAGNIAWRFDDTTTPDYKTDFLFHLGVGPQYDFARAFGIYAAAGMTTGVLRYIHTELELSVGAQVRVP
jgi:opacity protein-like surface antigen